MAKGNQRTRLLLNIATFLMHQDGVFLGDLAREFSVSKVEMKKIISEELNFSDIAPSINQSVSAYMELDKAEGDYVVEMVRTDALRTPVRLLEEEATALKLLLSAYDSGGSADVESTIDGLQQKLAAAVGREEEAESFAKTRPSMALDKIVVLLEDAAAYQEVAEIDYYSAEHRERMKRRIHPYVIFQEAGRYYVRGYCELRQSLRSFRVDRIAEVELTGDIFEAPKNAGFVPTAVPGYDGTTSKETFTVRFEPSIAQEVVSRWENAATRIRPQKDGSIEMRLPLYSRSWAIGWVLSFGPNAELLAPERLREKLVDQVEGMLEAVT